MELERQLGVRLDSDRDLERRLSEFSKTVVELKEKTDDLVSSAADQQSTVVRLGKHMERLETGLEAVQSRYVEMNSTVEVLCSDAHGTSETTAANHQYLDVMQSQVETLQLKVDLVGLKVTNLANEEKQGIQFGLQMLDRIYKIYDGIKAESRKQEGCGNVLEVQEYNELLPTPSSIPADCLDVTKSVMPSATLLHG